MPLDIGTAGWSIRSQHAALFSGEGSHLERYARVFPCVEINSSFYRPHRLATYERWARSTPEHFRFAVKAPKAITHQSALSPTPAEFQEFIEEVRHLGDKLGPILFQFPPAQGFDAARVHDFFALFRDLYRTGAAVVEPRHLAWFRPEPDKLLKQFQIARVVADPPPAPEAARPGGYQEPIYYRLHGSPRIYYSNYPADYLGTLAATLSAQSGAEVWCIFDNTALGAATENALSLIQNLRELGSLE